MGPNRHQRRIIAAVALGTWAFALFVGIAHACAWVEPSAAPAVGVPASGGERHSDAGPPPGCAQFCDMDVPVVAKLPPIDDHPDAQPLIIMVDAAGVIVGIPPPSRLAQAALSPSDVPPYLRVSHLRLQAALLGRAADVRQARASRLDRAARGHLRARR